MARTTSAPTSLFAAKLRAELTRQDLGVRTLARRIDPTNVDRVRRQLNRWLKGTRPSPENRERVEGALGIARGSLADEDDGDDPLRDALDGLYLVLKAGIPAAPDREPLAGARS